MAQSIGFCCGQLADALGSKVSYPGSSAYNATERSYWSLQEASLAPACIVTPQNAQDVSEAISIISGIGSCDFAIKGRGHAPAAGFANINAGITIDMTALSSVSVTADHTVASVGAGATWLDVYVFLNPLGLQVAGGRNGAVGVGGLTLGGGISYFLPRVGWTCDTVVNFEVVLASGKLVNANAESHPDLFRALKGGWGNFGVVTRIDFKPFPQGQILDGNLAEDISHREAVFKAFADITDAPYYDIYASIVTSIVFNSSAKTWSTSSTAIYTKPVTNPPVFQDIRAIPSTTNTWKLTNVSTLAAEPPIPKFNWLFFTGTYGVSATLLSRIFDASNATLFPLDIPSVLEWSIAFEPLPTVATQYGDLNGGNSLGTSPKDGNAFIMLVSALWTKAASNDAMEKAAQKLVESINDLASSMGLLHKFQYINYADPSQDPLCSYGPQNVQRLKEASRKYDPKSVFQTRVPGAFKLGPKY